MKKLILLALMSTLAMSGGFTNMNSSTVESEDIRLCKVFIKKAHTYKDTMRSDKLAQATLDSYKGRVVSHCGAVASKQPMNPFAAKFVLKNIEAKIENVELCKTAIETAQMHKDEAAFDSYKKDVVANCGTISAKV